MVIHWSRERIEDIFDDVPSKIKGKVKCRRVLGEKSSLRPSGGGRREGSGVNPPKVHGPTSVVTSLAVIVVTTVTLVVVPSVFSAAPSTPHSVVVVPTHSVRVSGHGRGRVHTGTSLTAPTHVGPRAVRRPRPVPTTPGHVFRTGGPRPTVPRVTVLVSGDDPAGRPRDPCRVGRGSEGGPSRGRTDPGVGVVGCRRRHGPRVRR